MNITWYESRAYARWLNGKILLSISKQDALWGYQVTLPTDLQWTRAACAANLSASDTREWPWGDRHDRIEQRANFDRLVGNPTAVGLYAPTPIGLHDMAGNVWEWMDTELNSNSETDIPRISPSQSNVDTVCLRGGSWDDQSEDASCYHRRTGHADNWSNAIGFRVVFSRPENES